MQKHQTMLERSRAGCVRFQISEQVAEASKEGGFFGGGGGPVSDKEKATLQEISSVLKLAA
jgi:hypothetical protein